MAGKSNIEWCTDTWNPVVGCSIVSPGCTNCYAMKMALRITKAQPVSHYADCVSQVKGNAVWTGKVAMAPDHIVTAPLRWKKPRRIFVNSMGDLFHESVPYEWIDRAFSVMALAPQHTFQVLTKRAKRMREYFEGRRANFGRCSDILMSIEHSLDEDDQQHAADWLDSFDAGGRPLPNVWLGVSAEDQERADDRIPDLLATPAVIRFVSAEPLLGPIDFYRIRRKPSDDDRAALRLDVTDFWWNVLDGQLGIHHPTHPIHKAWWGEVDATLKLNWVIVGGESGPGARPMHPDWARSIRDQCGGAGTAFFMKQMDKKTPIPNDLMIRQFPK